MLDNPLTALLISAIIAGEAAAGIPGTPVAAAFQNTRQGINTQPTAYLYKVGDRRYGFHRVCDAWGPVQSAAFTGSVSGTVLTVSVLASGTINVGDILSGSAVPANTTVLSRGTGTGGVGTYNLSNSLSVASEAMTTSTLTMVHTETQQYETTFQFSALATQNPATPTQYTASDVLNLIASILQSSATIAALQAQGVGIERITDVRNPYFLDDRDQNEAAPSFDLFVTHKQIVSTTAPLISATQIQIATV